ncbi:hypothetical protein [Saccharothrix xinjiangensis]|uniref:Uncharacterized protein n=1 Tax=Saccharothrix xinjiangensis TaxID=204798 RepID=A0ABV9XW50_9PSEU
MLDHPATAWANSDQDVLSYLPDDLVEQYRRDIDTVAANLIARHLINAWRERGYVVAFASAADLDASTDSPDDETYLAVWNAAAGRIDPDELSLAVLDGVRRSLAWPYQRTYDDAVARLAAAAQEH